jgi:hypothetical protein
MEHPNERLELNRASRFRGAAGLVAALAITVACNSNPARDQEEAVERGRTQAHTKTDAGQSNSGPGIDLKCVFEHLQNPRESFHYLYKKNASDGFNVHQEADVSPQAIDGFRTQSDGSQQALHGLRSDTQSWREAQTGITGISGMAGTVSTFNHSSAMQRESDGGKVNGYDTIHYSIDTARWDATTRQMLGNMTLGPGGFDKGDAWVTSEGCPVKLVLDDEMHNKDGSQIGKTHYEVAMIKK